MNKENARLAVLQRMSYDEYMLTPEWQATRKRMLRHVGSRCQMCHGESVHLEVHHWTDENLGREKPEDLIVLCESCYAQMQPDKQEEVPLISFGWKMAVFGMSTAISTIGLEGILHAPLPAEVMALIGAFVLARKSPQIYGKIKKHLPDPIIRLIEKANAHEDGEWSFVDRFVWGKHLHGDPPATRSADEETDEGIESLPPVFPAYRQDETLRLGQAIDREALTKLTEAFQRDPRSRITVTGQRFEPHINALFGKSMILAAVQGSGKSMLNGLVIEQSGECDAPVIVLDHKGEYVPITELTHLSGIIAGGESARKKAEKLGVSYFALTTENAYAFVEKVISEHLQAIVVLPSYGDSWLARATIVAEVGQALMRYSGRMRQEEKKVLPCLVFLDEAQLYLPQNVNLLPPEARRNSEVLENLSNAYFALVSNGRSNGYTMCFATQSLTYIAKWAIKSSQIRVIMRHVEVNDLDACERMVSDTVATREEIESMPAGVGVVFGFTPKPMVVQFDRRESRDDSETPGIERLREVRNVREEAQPRRKVADMTLDELMALIEAKSVRRDEEVSADRPNTNEPEDPDENAVDEIPPKNVTALPIPTLPEKGRKAEDVSIVDAVNVWNALMPSIKDMESIFGLNNHQARRLREKILRMAEARQPEDKAIE